MTFLKSSSSILIKILLTMTGLSSAMQTTPVDQTQIQQALNHTVYQYTCLKQTDAALIKDGKNKQIGLLCGLFALFNAGQFITCNGHSEAIQSALLDQDAFFHIKQLWQDFHRGELAANVTSESMQVLAGRHIPMSIVFGSRSDLCNAADEGDSLVDEVLALIEAFQEGKPVVMLINTVHDRFNAREAAHWIAIGVARESDGTIGMHYFDSLPKSGSDLPYGDIFAAIKKLLVINTEQTKALRPLKRELESAVSVYAAGMEQSPASQVYDAVDRLILQIKDALCCWQLHDLTDSAKEELMNSFVINLCEQEGGAATALLDQVFGSFYEVLAAYHASSSSYQQSAPFVRSYPDGCPLVIQNDMVITYESKSLQNKIQHFLRDFYARKHAQTKIGFRVKKADGKLTIKPCFLSGTCSTETDVIPGLEEQKKLFKGYNSANLSKAFDGLKTYQSLQQWVKERYPDVACRKATMIQKLLTVCASYVACDYFASQAPDLALEAFKLDLQRILCARGLSALLDEILPEILVQQLPVEASQMHHNAASSASADEEPAAKRPRREEGPSAMLVESGQSAEQPQATALPEQLQATPVETPEQKQ